jgi:putative pyoverdin transport system ATP-binding/permease protein
MTTRPSNVFSMAIGLLRPFWPIALLATVMGSVSGIAAAGLLATINNALHADTGGFSHGLIAFAALCLLTLAGEIGSDIGTNIVGQRVVAHLRRELCAKILTAPIDRIEQYQVHRLIAVLNADVDTISNFTFLFSPLAIASAVTVACLVYLLMLSPALFPIALVAIVAGIAVQAVARRYGLERFARARDTEDELQKLYRAVIEGTKELRINRTRRSSVFAGVSQAVGSIRKLRLEAVRVYCSANALGAALFFVVIGLVMTLQQVVGNAERSVLSGFVLVLLYMKSPVQQLVGALPLIGRAQVAFRRIAELSAQFANPEPHLAIAGSPGNPPPIEAITLKGTRYAFPAAAGSRPFELGPIDLSIRRGEIVFIVGENGCGKTTLIKLLLGLYAPQHGELLLNGKPVTADRRDDYRQLFSAVFFDYYLFGDVLGADAGASAEINRYRERLEIADKVAIVDGAFSTTDLSSGQRKRLALIQVYLEGRPIVVFDEWAAEQDPTFRRIFYEELLPDLQRQGKTLVVVSHDDRYFHIADRCVQLDAGRIVAAGSLDAIQVRARRQCNTAV